MILEPTIQTLQEIKLIGKSVRMSFAASKTHELWRSFMPRRAEITRSIGAELYSVEVYDDTAFFRSFNPASEFEKWAAVQVSDFNTVPDGMNSLIIPADNMLFSVTRENPARHRQLISTYTVAGSPTPNTIWMTGLILR